MFNKDEVEKILASSLDFAFTQQKQEVNKKGLSDFRMPDVKIQSKTLGPIVAVSCESIKKPKKADNQDRFFISTYSKFSYFGVCDGHGVDGGVVAETISENLPRILSRDVEGMQDITLDGLFNATRHAFQEMDEEIKIRTSGSTLACVIQTPLGLLFATIGDSRAVLDIQGKAYQYTADQTTKVPFFVKCVEMRGLGIKITN